MANSSSDSLDALSVSAYGKGLTTNDLTTDSQGTYCELGEQSQQLSQDMFLGSQDSQPSSIAVLDCSISSHKSSRQSRDDFSTITTSSTPLAKRKRGSPGGEEEAHPSSGADYQRRTKMKSSDKSPKCSRPESDTSGGGSRKNDTILISSASASGENSQLNFSQLDTQLKVMTDADEDSPPPPLASAVTATNGDRGDETVPLVLSGKSLSSSNGLSHSGIESHSLSSNSYNSHQIRSATPMDKWANRKTITKTYAANFTGMLREVRCESTNQVLSLAVTELTLNSQTPNLSPLLSKLGPVLSSGAARDSLSSGGSVYSAGAMFPLRVPSHEARMSSSSSSTLASSAAGLALRHLHKLSQRDLPPVQCVNCSYEFKAPLLSLLPPPVFSPDLISSGPENISSSLCEEDANTPPKTDTPSPPPIPILQATRRSSFNKKFTTLEQIKEEAKQTTSCSSLTPTSCGTKRRGRPPLKKTLSSAEARTAPGGEDRTEAKTEDREEMRNVLVRLDRRDGLTGGGHKDKGGGGKHDALDKGERQDTATVDKANDKHRERNTKGKFARIKDVDKSDKGEDKSLDKDNNKIGDKDDDAESTDDKEIKNSDSDKEKHDKGESMDDKEEDTNVDKDDKDRFRGEKEDCDAETDKIEEEVKVVVQRESNVKKGKKSKGSSAKKKVMGGRGEPKKCRRDLIGAEPGKSDVAGESIPPKLSVMAANVYDPGKTILAIWADKIYYPAVIEEDLQSFLRVKYLDGFVKKIIKQQTIPMSVLVEDTPVMIEADEVDLRPAKLKAFDEETQMCTVEWTDTSLVDTISLGDLRMLSDDVHTIQNRYTHVLETPKLHVLTLDNVLQRKRTPARRNELFSDGYSSASSFSSRSVHTPGSTSSVSSVSKRVKRSDKTPPLPIVEEAVHSLPAAKEALSKSSVKAVPVRSGAREAPSRTATRTASTGKKKKVLEEKVDNSGNRGTRCRQRIFAVETSSNAQKSTKSGGSGSGGGGGRGSKSSDSGGSCPPPAKRRRRSKGGPCPPGSPQPSCSKYSPGNRENKFRYSSRWEIDVAEEYCPSSDSELELESINMLGFEMDFVQSETDRESPLLCKSIDKLCGPIPQAGHDLFSGYVFVVSHSRANLTYESDGNLSDQQYAELTSKFPFRRRRLEEQLHKGGGTVYPSLNRVPHEKLDNCLLITDRPSTTCNFILALAMRVPVLHYYYVIQCCVNKSHIKKYRLPEMSSGYSLEDKCFLDRNLTSANILGDYMIVIAMSAKRHALIFWEKVLKFAGASVKRWKPGFDWDTLSSQGQNMQVAVLVDDDIPPDILTQPYDRIVPTWIIQSLIHAEAREIGAHSAYRAKTSTPLTPSAGGGLSTSETY